MSSPINTNPMVDHPYGVNLNQMLGREIIFDDQPPHIQAKLSQLVAMQGSLLELFEKAKASNSVLGIGLTHDYLHMFKEFYVVLRELETDLKSEEAKSGSNSQGVSVDPEQMKRWARFLAKSNEQVQAAVSQLHCVARSMEMFDDKLSYTGSSNYGRTADDWSSDNNPLILAKSTEYRRRACKDIKKLARLIVAASGAYDYIYHDIKGLCPSFSDENLINAALDGLNLSSDDEAQA
ncbi:hypothetical protein K449DRAFT_400495 [Hypoxylon sp. EC38]|nr:hypothetical protein K449DRAFT_400495 [Hypoxylon sp. EC38]